MANGLQRYREMRDFRITPEPRGKKVVARAERLRFYVQRHHATRLHYDFRLELEGTLKSWAVPKGPCLDPSVKRLAMQTEDHPLEYGEFEGTIPAKQYGAGDVLLWDQGEWIPEDADPVAALKKGRLHFELRGEKLAGRWVLTRTNSSEKKPAWLLIKKDDDEAREGDEAEITVLRPESVKQPARAGSRSRKSRVPEFLAPMLATLVTEPPAGGHWVYEVKYDGYRMLARITAEGVRLFTRTGNDWTAKLPHLAQALGALGLKDSLLDGEIVVPGEGGRSDFQALQNAFDAGNDRRVAYFVFDAPWLDGQDLRRLALAERKKRLAKKLEPSASVRLSEHLSGDAKEVLQKACELGLEGLIGKDARSVYASGRTRSWIKLKCRRRQDLVIGGHTAPKGSRQGFGALLVGFYDARGKLQYAGKVGTGFDDQLLAGLLRKMAGLKRSDSPFENPPREKGVTWLRPKLVGEVAYAEKTKEGLLRQASFLGLREDLPAKSVGDEKAVPPPASPDALPLKVTHPGRLVWPALKISKLELVKYYAGIGEWLLPHVKDRPLSLVRCPDGAGGKCFYQRHPGTLKSIGRIEKAGTTYIYARSMEDVLGAVQNGSIELHTWGSLVPDLVHPDRITMDLDPGPGIDWPRLVEATRLVKVLLDQLGLASFLKTTGGKGLHVVAPLEPRLPWDEVKEFTRLLAVMLTRARPDLFLAKMSKAAREGLIFVDYLRNSETASAVAAYSARARPDAGVSTPLSWDELDAKDDVRTAHTVQTVPARLKELKGDPWREYGRTRQSITPAMRKRLEK